MKIGLAYSSFFTSFKFFFPKLEMITSSNVKDFDLIIFSGGEDINPEIYHQENRCSWINPRRDEIEISVLKECLNLNKKVLGICRGHQLINAFLGGDLVQDLVKDLNVHHFSVHRLEILRDGIIPKYFNIVNSMHHQGVIKPGKNMVPTTFHNGVIESTESKNIITTQFHPEFMMNTEYFFERIEDWINE